MNKHVYQIAIDGPGGAGKSSIAQEVAKRLKFLFINTGGMYRCYALLLKQDQVDINDLEAVKYALDHNDVSLRGDKLFLNNKDVTDIVYTGEIAALASKIGTIGLVRTKCVADQQKIAQGQSCVMEGRDTTTVVLPNATLKIFLTASLEIRTQRRYLQFNRSESLERIKEDLIARDYQDSHRAIAPLIKAPDAITVDTSNRSFEENVNEIIKLFHAKEVMDA